MQSQNKLIPCAPRVAFSGGVPGGPTALITALVCLISGCASPGPPLPPSLKLPDIVATLTATRVGDEVHLRWTTPTRTTDGKSIAGPITAEICRDLYPNPLAAPPKPAQPAKPAPAGKPQAQPQPAAPTPPAPCSPLLHRIVQPGETEAVDTLPLSLASGPPQLLAYRIQLRNSAGRTAGPSAPAFTAAGAAPTPIEAVRGTSTKTGAVLEWTPQPTRAALLIELDRTTVIPPPPSKQPSPAGPKAAGPAKAQSISKFPPKPPAAPSDSTEEHLRVGDAAPETQDPGGTVDHTAEIGGTYRYTVQRVRTVTLGAYTVELRSAPSAPVTVAMLDVFPPNPPTGLVAAPGFVDTTAASAAQTQPPTIDLSWLPNPDPRLAGYRVYRREISAGTPATPWARLTETVIPTPGYRDLTVQSGHRYEYRVTAIDPTGNESTPSATASETAP